jgi:hypothetical protein
MEDSVANVDIVRAAPYVAEKTNTWWAQSVRERCSVLVAFRDSAVVV